MIRYGFAEKNLQPVNGLYGYLTRLALLYPSKEIC